MAQKTFRPTRQLWLARLAARPSALRLGQFEELEDDPVIAELIGHVERVEGFTPEQIAELSAEYDDQGNLVGGDLFDLRSALATGYAAARANVTTDAQVDALATVVAAIATVDGENTRRVTEAAGAAEAALAAETARTARLAELDAAAGLEGEEEPPAPGDGDEETPPAAPPAPPAPAAPEAPPAEAPPAQASAPAGRRANLALLRGNQRQDPQATPGGPSNEGRGLAFSGRVVAAAALADLGRGEVFDGPEQLGTAIERMANDLRVDAPSARKHYLGRAKLANRARVVVQDEFRGDDQSLIDEAVRRNLELKMGQARMVAAAQDRDTWQASGGVCIAPEPDYTITTVGERGTAWLDRIPTIQGKRPISYFPWINMSLTAAAGSRVGARPDGGIGFVTEAQDRAGYGGTNSAGVTTAIPNGGHAFKDCVRIDCPEMVNCGPEAAFKCTEVGNFMAVTFAEYVRVFDETVGFYFDVARDERALASFVARAKNLNAGAPVFGAAVDLLDRMRRLVAHVRSVRKAPNMVFNFDVPGFARYMIAQDIASSWGQGTDNLRVSAEQALAFLAIDEGIMIGTYDVSIGNTANGTPTVLPELVDGQDLPDWVDEIRILAYPEGGVFRQDYGELSFGLRETGMETNDFRGFYEVMESQCYRTDDLFTLDVGLCVNGARGAAVAKNCGAAAGTGVNEVQAYDLGNASAGSWLGTWDGETTAAIAYNASAATFKTRIEALSNVPAGAVETWKVGTVLYAQWVGPLGGQNVPQIVPDSTGLTGGPVVASTIVTGG